jgi:hypothetical protein
MTELIVGLLLVGDELLHDDHEFGILDRKWMIGLINASDSLRGEPAK